MTASQMQQPRWCVARQVVKPAVFSCMGTGERAGLQLGAVCQCAYSVSVPSRVWLEQVALRAPLQLAPLPLP